MRAEELTQESVLVTQTWGLEFRIPKTSKSHSDWGLSVSPPFWRQRQGIQGALHIPMTAVWTLGWPFALIKPHGHSHLEFWENKEVKSQQLEMAGSLQSQLSLHPSVCVWGLSNIKNNSNLKLLGNIVMYTHMTTLNNHFLLIPSREIKSFCGRPIQKRCPQMSQMQKVWG